MSEEVRVRVRLSKKVMLVCEGLEKRGREHRRGGRLPDRKDYCDQNYCQFCLYSIVLVLS